MGSMSPTAIGRQQTTVCGEPPGRCCYESSVSFQMVEASEVELAYACE